MPWPANARFYNFNEFSILLNAAPQYGVYAVFDAKQNPLLVDAGEVMVDLVRILEAKDPQLRKLNPALFSFVLADFAEAHEIKRRLVAEFSPPCNQDSEGLAQAAGA
jgi:hypothetical protein